MFDVRDLAPLSFVYDLPFGKGEKFAPLARFPRCRPRSGEKQQGYPIQFGMKRRF
jgi:hypothetical protein